MTEHNITKEQWLKDTVKVLEDAGFEVSTEHGPPLVKTPSTLEDKKNLLETKLPHGGYFHIFSEGMLVFPLGMKP